MIGQKTFPLEPRVVPLGGVRAMNVLRTLPHRDIPTVGAWCFLDRFGPDEVRMRVEPHPHIGLQTVTWPLLGEIRHRDSVGNDVTVQRGVLNLMTAGSGISHSEYSVTDEAIPLDALQFWVALPDSARHNHAAFEQHADLPTVGLGDEVTATVVLGELGGVISPATVHTPIVGAEIAITGNRTAEIPLRVDWEYAVLLVEGEAVVDGRPLDRNSMLFLGDSRSSIQVSGKDGALLFLIGGAPFEEDLVMWWNFAARTHEEIVQARDEWESGTGEFGHVITHGPERVPAPPLPHVRLLPRRRTI